MIKIQKFEDMLNLEFKIRCALASVQLANAPLHVKQARMRAHHKALNALDNALSTWTAEELRAYTMYRARTQAPSVR